MRCGDPHPADADRTCLKQGRHAHHNDGLGTPDSVWPNTTFIPRVVKKGKAPSQKDTKAAMSAFLAETDKAAKARTDDPETSHDAARALGDLRPAQEEVYLLFQIHGEMIDERLLEVAEIEGSRQTPSGLRSRRDELTKVGLLVDTGRKGKTSNDRDSIVWGLPSD